MAHNYLEWACWLTRGIRSFSTPPGDGLVGLLCGMFPDGMAEGASQAYRSSLMTIATQPDDALALLAAERMLPRYPDETADEHRARMLDAWNAYQYGGDESSILGQLSAAGWPGAQIYDAQTCEFEPLLDTNGNPWWSRFVVVFPPGTHPVTAEGPAWGTFVWGDGTVYGPVGLTANNLGTMRGIIQKWKPAQWICQSIVFVLSGWVYGPSHMWGEPGLMWGGSVAAVGA